MNLLPRNRVITTVLVQLECGAELTVNGLWCTIPSYLWYFFPVRLGVAPGVLERTCSMRWRINAGWLSFFCLVTMLISVVWSIQAAAWTPALDSLVPVTLAALVMGLLLSHLRYPRWFAHLVGLWAGVLVIAFQMVALVDPALDLRDRFFTVGWRISQWGLAAVTGQSNSDHLIFVLQLSIILWLVAFVAAWLVFHSHRPWWAIALTATPLLVNLYYAHRLNPNGFLILFAGSALLLLVRHNIYMQETAWLRARVSRTADAQWDLLWTGVIFTVLLVGAAWVVPGAAASESLNAAWDHMSQPWQEFQMHWYRLFSASEQGAGGLTQFDGTLQLKGPTSLSDMRVLEVKAPGPHYWRAVALDRYDGRQWTTSATVEVTVEEGDTTVLDRVEAAYRQRKTMAQRIHPRRPYGGLLLAGGQWVKADRTATFKTYVDPDDETIDAAWLSDVAMVHGRFTLFRSSEYIVYSSYSIAYVESLQEAGTEYSDWLRTRFLQLPSTLPDRVRDLAVQITADAQTPYDKAIAIERHLREHYTYDQTVSDPPGNWDGADYFLFESRRGYCTYFATAMVVLCRAVGVPARVATGYTAGEYDPDANMYVVLESNAHAWVEVYFPDYGWVEFEPSPATPALERARRPPPAGPSGTEPPGGGQPPPEREPRGVEEVEVPPETSPAPAGRLSLGWGGFLTLAILGLVLIVGGSAWAWWRWSLRGFAPADGIYERMRRLGRLLGVIQAPYQTDHEYARELSQAVPAGQPEIETITVVRVRSHFDRHKPGTEEYRRVWTDWEQLRGKMLAHLWQRVSRWIPREKEL